MLPTQKTPPKRKLQDLTILLYSKQKFGKSELCSHAEGALFLATEAGLNSLEVFQVPISTWEELLDAAREIAEGKHPYKTIIIDTVDNAYRMCSEHILKKNNVLHESDLPYGKGYALVNNEFHRVLTKLSLLPYGLMLVSHAQEIEVETRTGKIAKAVPTIPETPRKIVMGMADIIVYGDVEPIKGEDGKTTYKRVLRTKPSPHWDAGDRTKRLPETLDCSYAAFAAALAVPEPTPTGTSTSTSTGARPATEPAAAQKPKTPNPAPASASTTK